MVIFNDFMLTNLAAVSFDLIYFNFAKFWLNIVLT